MKTIRSWLWEKTSDWFKTKPSWLNHWNKNKEFFLFLILLSIIFKFYFYNSDFTLKPELIVDFCHIFFVCRIWVYNLGAKIYYLVWGHLQVKHQNHEKMIEELDQLFCIIGQLVIILCYMKTNKLYSISVSLKL